MRAPSDLVLLSAYRGAGQAPTLPIFVTNTSGPFAQNMRDIGAMVISVWNLDAAHEWDWSAIAGLEVLLALSDPATEASHRLARSIMGSRPRRLRVIDWSAPAGERVSAIVPGRAH